MVSQPQMHKEVLAIMPYVIIAIDKLDYIPTYSDIVSVMRSFVKSDEGKALKKSLSSVEPVALETRVGKALQLLEANENLKVNNNKKKYSHYRSRTYEITDAGQAYLKKALKEIKEIEKPKNARETTEALDPKFEELKAKVEEWNPFVNRLAESMFPGENGKGKKGR